MPLTPEEVQKKTFTPVRLREGYDMGEVDQFLDEVQSELTRLIEDNDELRARVATASTAAMPPGEPATAESDSAAGAASTPVAPPLPVVRTVPEASAAAARLLEIATNNAEQLVSEAAEEAERVLGEARSSAEQLEGDARARSGKLDAETEDRRQQMLGALEQDKLKVASVLGDLRSFEQEYRGRLRKYFEVQLDALDGKADGGVVLSPLTDTETPRRLKELLGEDT